MDPLSITAGSIGITVFALSNMTRLREYISSVRNAGETLEQITSYIDGIQRPLAMLNEISIPDNHTSAAIKEDLKKAGLALAVNKCGKACEEFLNKLRKWTRNSSKSELSLWDQFSVGIWRREKIHTFLMHIRSCQATVEFAVSTTQLIVQHRSVEISRVDRMELDRKLDDLATKMNKHLELTKSQRSDIENLKHELQEEIDEEEDGGAEQERTLALQELREQLSLLEEGQISCGVISLRLHSERTSQEISDVLTRDDSNALVGLPESVVGEINQRVRNITTEKHSSAMVGVFDSNVNMQSFFR